MLCSGVMASTPKIASARLYCKWKRASLGVVGGLVFETPGIIYSGKLTIISVAAPPEAHPTFSEQSLHSMQSEYTHNMHVISGLVLLNTMCLHPDDPPIKAVCGCGIKTLITF